MQGCGSGHYQISSAITVAMHLGEVLLLQFISNRLLQYLCLRRGVAGAAGLGVSPAQ